MNKQSFAFIDGSLGSLLAALLMRNQQPDLGVIYFNFNNADLIPLGDFFSFEIGLKVQEKLEKFAGDFSFTRSISVPFDISVLDFALDSSTQSKITARNDDSGVQVFCQFIYEGHLKDSNIIMGSRGFVDFPWLGELPESSWQNLQFPLASLPKTKWETFADARDLKKYLVSRPFTAGISLFKGSLFNPGVYSVEAYRSRVPQKWIQPGPVIGTDTIGAEFHPGVLSLGYGGSVAGLPDHFKVTKYQFTTRTASVKPLQPKETKIMVFSGFRSPSDLSPHEIYAVQLHGVGFSELVGGELLVYPYGFVEFRVDALTAPVLSPGYPVVFLSYGECIGAAQFSGYAVPD